MRSIARGIATLTAAVLAVGPALATWSIVVVDLDTGEVCVATATCLTGTDIQKVVPIIVVGRGAGAAQSIIDSGAVARNVMWTGFETGDSPDQILTDVLAAVNFDNNRQYGIVALQADPPATYTGSNCAAAAGGLSGSAGSMLYSIQGNILTGSVVWKAAKHALLTTPGDLGQRVMAAMEAARSMGGDGRCSCSVTAPTSCGAPPASFTKSAHTACIVLARVGDADGNCNGSAGCANGPYYLSMTVKGNWNDPDPVIELQGLYDTWRQGLLGRPDHILSVAETTAMSLPADGLATTEARLWLFDVDGVPLTTGGATLSFAHPDGLPGSLTPGAVTDHGDGSYSFDVTAGTQEGVAKLAITADDGTVQALLYPYLELRLDAPAPLHAGQDAVSAADGASVPFTIDLGASSAMSSYLLVGSASGTSPGLPWSGLTVPLNWDDVMWTTLTYPGPPLLPGSFGVLDAVGRATASLEATPGLLDPLIGLHLDWALIALGTAPVVTNAVGFDILP